MIQKHKMCEMCGQRPATVFIKKSINGVSTEKHLCPQCAAMLQNQDMYEDIFDGDFIGKMLGLVDDTPKTRMRVCPKCGTTERDVLNNYKFGCSECYKTFSDLVDKFVGELGGKTYGGDISKPLPKVKQVDPKEKKIQELKEELNKAVDNQDYLKANDIKQQIDKLVGKKGA